MPFILLLDSLSLCSSLFVIYKSLSSLYLMFHPFQVVQAGLNVDIAPDLVASQLNVRNGALVLQVLDTYSV